LTGGRSRISPFVILGGKAAETTPPSLIVSVAWRRPNKQEVKMDLYDVIILGAGPAGLSAAIYLARAQYRVLVIEKGILGGQITITSEVVNYPGVLKTDGKELTHEMYLQAESFGAEFLKGEIVNVDLASDKKRIDLKDGRSHSAILTQLLSMILNKRDSRDRSKNEKQSKKDFGDGIITLDMQKHPLYNITL